VTEWGAALDTQAVLWASEGMLHLWTARPSCGRGGACSLRHNKHVHMRAWPAWTAKQSRGKGEQAPNGGSDSLHLAKRSPGNGYFRLECACIWLWRVSRRVRVSRHGYGGVCVWPWRVYEGAVFTSCGLAPCAMMRSGNGCYRAGALAFICSSLKVDCA